MASEITWNCGLGATKNNVTVGSTATTAKTQNMATALNDLAHHTQTLVTNNARVAVDLVDVSGGVQDYVLKLKNASLTNTAVILVEQVEHDGANYSNPGKMYPGEFFSARLPAYDGNNVNRLYLRPLEANARVEVIAIEAGDPTA
jgi:hypothetical protein